MQTKRVPTTLPELFLMRAESAPGVEAVRYKKDGRWTPILWRDLEARVRGAARGLADWLPAEAKVAILSENCPEWWIADLAVLCLGGVTVPIYPTNPDKDVAYILNDSGARILFVSGEAQLEKIRRLRAAGRVPRLERVVSFDPMEPEGGWLLSLDALATRNPDAPDAVEARSERVRPEQLATLIYTSGTTGEPKGVMLSHKNIVSNVLGAYVVLDYIDLPERLMLSFLPLSHSFERTIGFYTAIHHRFTVAFAESVQTLVSDMGEVHPTLLVSVPRIYEKLYSRVMESASRGLKRRILDWSLRVGGREAAHRLADEPVPALLATEERLARRLVFEKIHQTLGGRLKYAISGGAPLAPEVAEFLNAIGLTVFEGYGLTETSPIVAANRPGANRVGTVGTPWPDVEVRIAPEPGREKDGEVLVRGPNVMMGYYNKPDETRAAIDEEGWFHTGDIGFVDETGMLHITDRKKELIKTSGGKYVAPQPIENALKVATIVEQAVLVGDKRPYCVALLVPSFEALEAHLGRSVSRENAALNTDKDVRRAFQEIVDEVNHDLGRWEQVKRFHLLSHEMTQETGELTPTLKLKRRVVEAAHGDAIEAMYEAAPPQAERRREMAESPK